MERAGRNEQPRLKQQRTSFNQLNCTIRCLEVKFFRSFTPVHWATRLQVYVMGDTRKESTIHGVPQVNGQGFNIFGSLKFRRIWKSSNVWGAVAVVYSLKKLLRIRLKRSNVDGFHCGRIHWMRERIEICKGDVEVLRRSGSRMQDFR